MPRLKKGQPPRWKARAPSPTQGPLAIQATRWFMRLVTLSSVFRRV